MSRSSLFLIKDSNLRDISLKFSHFSENLENVFIHFNDSSISERHIVAKKIHGGYSLQAENQSPFFELIENIFQNNSDLSIQNLNALMIKEVSLYKEERFMEKKPYFDEQILKFEKLEKQYRNLNIFTTPINKWEEGIISPLFKLKNNELIGDSHKEYKTKFSELEEKFISYQKAYDTSVYYNKIIESFVKNAKKESKEIKKIQNLFLNNLTFEKALVLPEPKVALIFNMLLLRKEENGEIVHEVRSYENIDEMLSGLN